MSTGSDRWLCHPRYPADYLNSGVMSFLINRDGVTFQKDLGERTSDVAEGMTAFNLGDGWTALE
jgi:hypothetical protein